MDINYLYANTTTEAVKAAREVAAVTPNGEQAAFLYLGSATGNLKKKIFYCFAEELKSLGRYAVEVAPTDAEVPEEKPLPKKRKKKS